MPFTFAHPAIVLPFGKISKRYVSLTALVVGSMTPDFEYFLRMRIASAHSHTLDGIFWFDLPLGILLCFVFHLIARNLLIENLPAFLQRRFSHFKSFDWNAHFKKYWLTIIISLIIGAASHIFWDGFTHEDGYFAENIEALKENFKVGNFEIPVYKMAQHLSTLVGFAIISFVVIKIPETSEVNKVNYRYWISVITFSALVFTIRYFALPQYNQPGNVLVSVIASIMAGLVSAPLIFKSKRNKL